MAKKLIIIVGIAIIAGIGAAIFFSLQSKNINNNSQSGESSDITPGVIPGAPKDLQIPLSDTLQIGTPKGTVTVNNFYRNIVGSEDEFLIIASTTDYQITYDTENSSFYMQLATQTNRNEAEQAFIGLLVTAQSDLCKLDVHEGWPGSPTEASMQPGLSFCQSNK